MNSSIKASPIEDSKIEDPKIVIPKIENSKTVDSIIDYNHLITTRPHDIDRVLISDLHLSVEEPALVQAFFALLDDLIVLPNLSEFYILGDWFEVWVGDDAYLTLSGIEKQKHWLTPIIERLNKLYQNGCQTFVMHGNRDFMVGQKFCDAFHGKLIAEPYVITFKDRQFRLEHGDALCTDDKAYQRFRKIMRNPAVKWVLLKQPLQKRIALARNIRNKSTEGKQTKPKDIMDVNEQAVLKVFEKSDIIVHGHTHRPAIHKLPESNSSHNEKVRYVMGDWRLIDPESSYQKVEAVIGVFTKLPDTSDEARLEAGSNNNTEEFMLVKFQY